MDTSAGDDFLGLCDQVNLCNYVSDFGKVTELRPIGTGTRG